MSDLERLLSTVVHDLKNPLHSIVLFIAALKQSEDPERIRYLIDQLEKSTRGLDGLFKRLLDVSRISSGATKASQSVFAMHTIFDTLENQFGIVAEGKELNYFVTLSEPVFVIADPVITLEILINLLSNAFRYTNCGSVWLRGKTTGESFLIEVCDTGEGISKDKQQLIFDEFFQLEKRSTESLQGYGLGLAIVRQLAASMGVQISLQSELGKGSTFSFSLPLSKDTETICSPLLTKPSLRGLLVLVVDDDSHALAAMEALLVASGCFVMLARDLAEAAKKLEVNERFPDILISESMLSTQSGEIKTFEDVSLLCTKLMGFGIPHLIVTKLLPEQFNHKTRPKMIRKPASSEEILNGVCSLLS
jgi:two-component system, sensor histidine kinase